MDSLTVCVNYADYLRVTLPANKRFFDRCIVVTDGDDVETVQVCEHNGAFCLQTNLFYFGGAKFFKGLAMDAAFHHIPLDGWLVTLDADILVPDEFGSVNVSELTQNQISAPSRKYHAQTGETGSNVHHEGHGAAGFLQLFYGPHLRSLGEPLHPARSGNCSIDDILFSMKFAGVNYLDMAAIHLGPTAESGKPNINWNGRQSPPCPYTADDVPGLLRSVK